MKSEYDKEKLVAFALGELRGLDAKEVEEQLENDPEAKRFVEEIRGISMFASRDLKGEPLPSGGGLSPILKKIAQSKESEPTPSQVWMRAGAIALVIILFVMAFPLRKHFGGNVSKIFGVSPSVNEEEVVPRPTERTMGDDPRAIESEFEAMNERARLEHAAGDCHFALPVAQPGDKIHADAGKKSLNASFLFAESGSELLVTVSQALQPLVKELGVVEVAKREGYKTYRRQRSDQELTYYRVPDDSMLPYCVLQIHLDGKFSEASKRYYGAALDRFGQSAAESMTVEKR